MLLRRVFFTGVKILVDAGADLDLAGIATPIFMAAQKNFVRIVGYLLDKGADFRGGCRSSGKIIRSIAEKVGQEAQERANQLLLQRGLALDSEAELVISPLEVAQMLGHQGVIDLIQVRISETLNYSANPNGFFGVGGEHAGAKECAVEQDLSSRDPGI